MINRKDVFAYTIFAIILFPVIFGFLGTDSAIYLQAGSTILNGEKIYVDFIDIKTPLFFTSYSIISLLINGDPNYLHLFIFIILLFTTVFLFHFIKKEFNYRIALSTSIIYSLTTLIVGHTLYYHTEIIYGFLLLLIIVYYTKNYEANDDRYFKKSSLNRLKLGVLIGLYISLKYTFAIVLIPFLFIDFFYDNPDFKNSLKKNLYVYPLMLFTIIASHFWLVDSQIFEGYKETLRLLSNYANHPPISSKLLRDIVKVTGQFFGDHLSLLFTFSAFVGFISVFKNTWTSKQKFIIITSFLLVGALLLSVYIERKLIIYHFSRLLIPFSIISGIGIVLLTEKLKDFWTNTTNKTMFRTLIFIFVLFLLIIGPIARYIGILRFPYNAIKGKEKYYKFIDQQRPNFFNYTEKLKLVDFVNRNYDSSYQTFIISIGSFDLIYELKTKVIKKLPQRNAFLPKPSNTSFYDEFIKFLKTSDLLIFQKNDGMFENLTGNTKSSLQLAKEDKLANRIIEENYKIMYETNVYVVYQKKTKNSFIK